MGFRKIANYNMVPDEGDIFHKIEKQLYNGPTFIPEPAYYLCKEAAHATARTVEGSLFSRSAVRLTTDIYEAANIEGFAWKVARPEELAGEKSIAKRGTKFTRCLAPVK